jgi:hypothetical protein
MPAVDRPIELDELVADWTLLGDERALVVEKRVAGPWVSGRSGAPSRFHVLNLMKVLDTRRLATTTGATDQSDRGPPESW